MEKIKDSKIARFVDKLAVSSEPGLTNAQLMLTNYDLKPGASEQRQIRKDPKLIDTQSNLNVDNGAHGTSWDFGSQIPSISYDENQLCLESRQGAKVV
jgi:hypothetical protein